MMILYNYLAELKKQGVQILHIIVLDPGLQRNDILELYQKEMAGPGYEILCIQKSSLFEKRKHSYEALQSIPPPDEAIEAIKNFHPDVLFCFEMPFDEIETIQEVDSFTGEVLADMNEVRIFPAAHNVTTKEKIDGAIDGIKAELTIREKELLDAKEFGKARSG
jgi:hypothetical protein